MDLFAKVAAAPPDAESGGVAIRLRAAFEEKTMEEILTLASRLGRMISETDRFEALRQAEKAALADKEAQSALKELQETENRLSEKEKAGQPIEVEEKHRLAELQERVRENDTLWKLAQAQADYMELLNRVNQSVHQHLKLDRNKEKEE